MFLLTLSKPNEVVIKKEKHTEKKTTTNFVSLSLSFSISVCFYYFFFVCSKLIIWFALVFIHLTSFFTTRILFVWFWFFWFSNSKLVFCSRTIFLSLSFPQSKYIYIIWFLVLIKNHTIFFKNFWITSTS